MSRQRLIERFLGVVAVHPDRPAVSEPGRRLSYAELDRASAAAAREIERRGAGPGDRLALLVGHRSEALVGLLGALRSGRCIVPLNARESDAFVLETAHDAGAAWVLADGANESRARSLFGGGSRVIVLDAVERAAGPDASDAVDPVDRPAASATLEPSPEDAEDLVAILYTSGTTARPKGVMTTAACVLERAEQFLRDSAIAPGERQAGMTAWHFAASIPEVYGALLAGAELCLFDASARGVDALPGWIADERIDLLHLPVAIARHLLVGADRAPGLADLGGLRFVSLSGDRMKRDEAAALLAAMKPGATLLHVYGSSESNLVSSLALRLPTDAWPADSRTGHLSVGRPAAGKRVLILDEQARPRPPGEEGRIAVASTLLSPGYWRQPEQTCEAFRTLEDGTRIYWSGDFGRLREDGLLEVVGRDTSQIKIRGMRVDLGSVEAAIQAVDGVAHAAVVARPSRTGDVGLVGYVEAARGARLDTSRLRRALDGQLPSHAIPARFVFLDAFPLTVNGKLDRRRLPEPDGARPRMATIYRAPRDVEEQLVCASWAACFELDEVGADDEFFELGGDSLALVEMLSALERETGRSIPVERIAGIPTPARIAAILRAADDVEGSGDRGSRPDPRRHPSALRRARSRAKRILRNPLAAVGPVAFGRPLDHGRGMRLQRALATGIVRAGLYRSSLRPIAQWHARLACETPLESSLVRSLCANTWSDWRLRALARASAFERDVVVDGAANLDAVVDRGSGLVIAVTHVGWNGLIAGLPGLAKRARMVVRQPKGFAFGGGRDAVVTARAEQLQAATRLLRGGGIVLIAGDAGHGRAVVERPFYGTVRHFWPGAAALAEASGAAVLPLFSWLRDDGRIVLRFEEALDSDAESPSDRILERTARYADLLIDHWPRIFDSVGWKSARLALEPADARSPDGESAAKRP